MLKGKPRCVAWSSTDAVMRLFEMDGADVFQEIANTALANVGSFVPDFAFSKDGDYVMAGGNRVAATFTEASFDAALAQISTQTVALSSTTPLRLHAKNYKYGLHMVNAQTLAFIHSVDESNGNLLRDNRTGTLDGTTQVKRAFTKDGMTVVSLYNTLSPSVRVNTATSMLDPGTINERPNYTNTNVNQTAFNILCTEVVGSHDNQFLYFGAANGNVYVCPFTANNSATSVGASLQTVAGTGAVHRISVSPDDKYVAVSRVNAGVYTTVVYTRVGGTLTLFQTINGFGQSLAFSGDGFFLIDGIMKQARKFDGTNFAAANGAMANLPATVSSFALSQHVDGVSGFARAYNEAVHDYATCGVDNANLKMMLLTGAAAFVATHTNISQVTNGGAFEASGSGWAAGGQALTGVTYTVNLGGETEVTANPINVTLTGALSFRYALIYDDTSDTPIALIDYIDVVNAPALTTLNFDLSSPGWFKFTPV